MIDRLKIPLMLVLSSAVSTQLVGQVILPKPEPNVTVRARTAQDSAASRRGARQITVMLRSVTDTTLALRSASVFLHWRTDTERPGLSHLATNDQGIAMIDSLPSRETLLEIRAMGYVGIQVDLRVPSRCHTTLEAFLEPWPPLGGDGPTPPRRAPRVRVLTCPADP